MEFFSSLYDRLDETENGIRSSSLKKLLEDNREEVANRGKFKEHLPLECFFGFRENFKEI